MTDLASQNDFDYIEVNTKTNFNIKNLIEDVTSTSAVIVGLTTLKD